ncbi:hypothetical protein [Nitrosomonas sp.]|uniref:hypothetical protein n=1 Tax=Nitrosomonas sp. TaxID=42353 RepID=UPI00272FA46B|nr:hypothetical protein [Nitrosomonas sp.]MDP2224455.1 hypothetical protein [Nitrosomonas sp.]
MIDWVINNKEWVFSGVGIPALGTLFWVFRYLGQRKPQGSLLITQIEQSRSPGIIPQEIPVSVPIAMHRTSPVTPNELQTSILSAPPLQKKVVAERYISQRIEWDTELSGAEQQGSLVRLYLSAVKGPDSKYPHPVFVWCDVKLDEYRELTVLPEKAHIRINGTITEVSLPSVRLDNASLAFPSLKNVA